MAGGVPSHDNLALPNWRGWGTPPATGPFQPQTQDAYYHKTLGYVQISTDSFTLTEVDHLRSIFTK